MCLAQRMASYKNPHSFRALFLDPLYKSMSDFDVKDRNEAISLYKIEFVQRVSELEDEKRLVLQAAKVAAEIAAAEKATAKKAAAEKAIAEREGEDVERNDDPMDEDPHVADDEESDDVEDPYDRRHDARVDSSANIERTLNF